MGDFSWVQELLKLLFGQVGVLGTVLIGIAAYIAYLHKKEMEAHEETRRRGDEVAEKRTVLFETYLKTLSDLKIAIEASSNSNRIAIDTLAAAINRKRSL